MLESNDLPATIRFYTEILGFKVDNTFEHEGVLNWVSFIRMRSILCLPDRILS